MQSIGSKNSLYRFLRLPVPVVKFFFYKIKLINGVTFSSLSLTVGLMLLFVTRLNTFRLKISTVSYPQTGT